MLSGKQELSAPDLSRYTRKPIHVDRYCSICCLLREFFTESQNGDAFLDAVVELLLID